MKTENELIELREEYENLKKKLRELTEEELKLVTGGVTRFSTESAGESLIKSSTLFLPVEPPTAG